MIKSEGSVVSISHSVSRPSNGVTEPDKVGYRVLLPPARYIPLSVTDIVDSMKSHIPHAQRAVFTEICQLIEGKALTEFMGIRRRVKKNFRFFSAAAMHRDIPTRRVKKEETMDEMEVVFLRDLWELMEYAHYSALSEADWLAAKQERLMLDMPIKINWDHCDPRLFSRFYSRFPDRAEGLYKHKDNLMIFHRGVGVIRKKDLFIAQKIDLLVKYLVAWPAKQVFYKIAPYLWQSARDKAAKMKQKDIDKSTDPNSLNAGRALDHKHAYSITRVSLRLLMPTWRSVFSRLMTPCEIVEPTYKDIISVYRKTIKPPSEKALKDDPSLGDKFRRDQRGIVVKRFDELPVADLEILLPDKTIGLKLIDNLTLYGTGVGALVGGIVAFFGANIDLNFVLSTLGVVSGKLFQTYSKMEAKKAELMKQMSQTVFDISMDSQEGAIYSVLDEMADQFVKEMLLAYFLLLKHKYPATEDELDEICEEYLEDRFDVKIDFAIEDSLPRLLRDGLVEPGADASDPRIKAVPMEVAHERLLEKWKTAFSYDSSSSATLSEQLCEPVAALKGGLTHLGGAMGDAVSSVTAFIPGVGKKSKRSWFSKKSQ